MLYNLRLTISLALIKWGIRIIPEPEVRDIFALYVTLAAHELTDEQ